MILFYFVLSCSLVTMFIMIVTFWSSSLSKLSSNLLSGFSSSYLPFFSLNHTKNNDKVNGSDSDNNQLMAINVANFHDRITELEQDFAEKNIHQHEFKLQKAELQRQLIQAEIVDVSGNSFSSTSKIIFSLCVMVLTGLAYFFIESRQATHQHWTNQQKYSQVAEDILTGTIDIPPDWSIETPSTRHALLTAMQANVHQHTNSSDGQEQRTNSRRWLRMSQLLLSMEQTDSALIAMERAVRLENDYTSLNYAKLATNYAKTSYFAHNEVMPVKAEKVLKTLITYQPQHKGAVILLVMNATRQGKHQKALALVEDLRKNIEIEPKSTEKNKALASLDALIMSIKTNQKLMVQ